ncbi:MAG: cyclic pyranopterin monophosphate synthase MoaC [Planctomycetes bacterium]|nr:cyclic pyranopterin monophosphate synthase MoaC [Planctomycetota bacterium]
MTRTPDRKRALSHVERSERGDGANTRSRMVDVGGKPPTERKATARASVRFPSPMVSALFAGRGPKGAITEIARAAGLLAAKRTAELIPMCHPLALSHLEILFRARGARRIEVTCTATCVGPTGVEMEAMVGASVAALTIYDMTKALDHGIAIEAVELVEKRGGKSGVWRRGARRRAR